MRSLTLPLFYAEDATGSHKVELVEFIVDPDDDTKQFRYTTAYKDLEYSGENYLAAGNLLAISGIKDTITAKTSSVSVSLNALDTGVISFLGENQIIGTAVNIRRGWLNSFTKALATSYSLWEGIVSDFEYSVPLEGSVNIQLNCTSTLDAILRLETGRFTSQESFRQHNANDASMEFIPALVDQEFAFGKEN